MHNIKSQIKVSDKRKHKKSDEISLADYICSRDDYIHAELVIELESKGMEHEEAWKFVTKAMEDGIVSFEQRYPEEVHKVVSTISIPSFEDSAS